MEKPAYLVFDIESAADPELISKVHFGGKVPPEESVRKYRDALLAQNNSDFIPYTFQYPVCVVIGKVAKDFSLMDIVVLDEPQCRPHEICKIFWNCLLKHYETGPIPVLVSFNGRGFDIPMLELSAFRYGIPIPKWFTSGLKSPRYRYNTDSHLDLCEVLTNSGASRFNGGLNLAASLLGKPGKMDTQGFMVQDMYEAGKLVEINDYCRCDVLDTYFVFLRVMLLSGKLTLQEEQNLVRQTKDKLMQQSEKIAVYKQYLDNWGDWKNPWDENAAL
ncbi:MAG: 3'-5' exonuclease [Planctomycetaceae bacterium]|jgi:predicted PolB exonuclease-like 3'-5' exonuclease|nr:3'-5' exonuclease [Planctomycetaceae bacterium]